MYAPYDVHRLFCDIRFRFSRQPSDFMHMRFVSLQVWKTHTQEFLFQDKYYGRSLTPASFQQTLLEFLSNGPPSSPPNLRHIPPLLRKLRRLARSISSLSGYRFYA